MTRDLAEILGMIERVDLWLDQDVAQEYKDQPLAQDWARVAKELEERGESIAELILATGQNPRKGRDPGAQDRLVKELGDRAITSLLAMQHFTKHAGQTWAAFVTALAKADARARSALGEETTR